jgi:hypothetical protein
MAKSEQTNVKDTMIISKMSVKSIGCVPAGAEDPGKRLCIIFGRASGLKTGEDKVRDSVWVALTGEFEAFRFPHDGEPAPKRYQSGKLFLPAGIHDTIESAVRQIMKGGEETAGLSVKFALELYSVKSSNPSGYSYQARTVIPMQETDELSELRRAIVEAGKVQLPAGAFPLHEREPQRITSGDVGPMPTELVKPAAVGARKR